MLDSTFDGRFHTWEKYPDWKGKFGFTMAKCPETEETRLHVDSGGKNAPRRAVVRYRISPSVEGNLIQLRRKLSTDPVFFTSFVYYDQKGRTCEISRTELVTAFYALVDQWQTLFDLACAVHAVWNDTPWLDEKGAPLLPNSEETIQLDNELLPQVQLVARHWAQLSVRLYREAEYFSQYLQYFLRLERKGKMPAAFSRYPGVISKSLDDKFQRKRKIKVKHGQIDDWAFRMARVVNDGLQDHWPRVQSVRDNTSWLTNTLLRILEVKGYDAEEEVKKYYPPLNKDRHVRLKKKE